MLLTPSARGCVLHLLVALLVCVGGCSCGYHAHTADGAVDAPTDAPSDVMTDAPVDAPRDAPRDTRTDASDPDVAFLGCDPGWHPLPSIPDDLEVLYADNPSCLLNVAWVSCGPGCQRLADDPRFERSVDPNSSWVDGGRAFFTMAEGLTIPTRHPGRIVVVASTDGMVHGAWLDSANLFRDPNLTGIDGIGGAGGQFGASITTGLGTTDGNFSTYHALIYQAPLASMTGPIEPTLQLDTLPPGSALQYIKASATTLTAEVQPLAKMLVVEDGREHWLGGPGSATPHIPAGSVLVGREVFWLDWGARSVRIAHGNFDMESEVFLEIADADTLGLASDGTDLAWIQAYEPNAIRNVYARTELWTAPFTADPASLSPRMVASLSNPSNRAMLGDGYYAVLSSTGTKLFSRVYSLADGSVQQWDNPDALILFPDELWVQGSEVAYSAVLRSPRRGTIIRLSTDEAYHSGITDPL